MQSSANTGLHEPSSRLRKTRDELVISCFGWERRFVIYGRSHRRKTDTFLRR
jgi:hypothetical protein